MTDARFEDGAPRPLRLQALTAEDLGVISALVQDAVFPITEMSLDRPARRFAILLNRVRWEKKSAHEVERVQSVLSFENVAKVQTQGIDRRDMDQILSLLSITLEEGNADRVVLTLAGDGGVAVQMSALDVTLRDVTRPYPAVSGKAPHHPD
ncbi:DUF2948 family protein [Oceaniglobus roseus]|uniref:DUF2948 family protein n=1 Tax=Oceaniglobus roseus TaxID=1737570 RepID=UPI000C7F12DE|nr:DUF2948 family protein [Kandeliimicrobium roseum]